MGGRCNTGTATQKAMRQTPQTEKGQGIRNNKGTAWQIGQWSLRASCSRKLGADLEACRIML